MGSYEHSFWNIDRNSDGRNLEKFGGTKVKIHCRNNGRNNMGTFIHDCILNLQNVRSPVPGLFVQQARFHQLLTKKTKLRSALKMESNQAISQQKIALQNKHNEKLVGVLHDTGSASIVVLCHGFGSSKDQKTLVNLASTLEKEGISEFRFDFAGNGESEGSFQYGNYMGEVEDLRSVVEFFVQKNRKITSVVGHSKGGNIVLLYGSKYHDIGSIVNVSGRYKMDGGIKERLGKDFLEKVKKDGYIDVKNRAGVVQYRVTEESLMDRLNTNMHEACLAIDKSCRVLTVHGSADKIIPVADAFEFGKMIPNHKLHIIEGANHGYTNHEADLASVVSAFVKEGLQQNS